MLSEKKRASCGRNISRGEGSAHSGGAVAASLSVTGLAALGLLSAGVAAQEASDADAAVPDDVAGCFTPTADLDIVGGRLVDGVRLGISRSGSILEQGDRLAVSDQGDDLVARADAARIDRWQAEVSAVSPSQDFDGCDVLEYAGPAYEVGEEANCRFSADVAVCPESCQLYDGAWKVVCDDDSPKVIASGSFSRS